MTEQSFALQHRSLSRKVVEAIYPLAAKHRRAREIEKYVRVSGVGNSSARIVERIRGARPAAVRISAEREQVVLRRERMTERVDRLSDSPRREQVVLVDDDDIPHPAVRGRQLYERAVAAAHSRGVVVGDRASLAVAGAPSSPLPHASAHRDFQPPFLIFFKDGEQAVVAAVPLRVGRRKVAKQQIGTKLALVDRGDRKQSIGDLPRLFFAFEKDGHHQFGAAGLVARTGQPRTWTAYAQPGGNDARRPIADGKKGEKTAYRDRDRSGDRAGKHCRESAECGARTEYRRGKQNSVSARMRPFGAFAEQLRPEQVGTVEQIGPEMYAPVLSERDSRLDHRAFGSPQTARDRRRGGEIGEL